MFRFLCLISFLFAFSHAQAVEIYSVLTQECQLVRGLIVDINKDSLDFIDLDGSFKRVARDGIEFLVVHNTLENPFLGINLNRSAKTQLLDIYVSNNDKKLFSGWAVKFIENLVIFFDLDGGTHVLELNQITKIRPTNLLISGVKKISGESVDLKFGNIFFKCPHLQNLKNNSKKSILPTRTLGDKVQVSEFLSNFEVGFRNLRSFQERTYLYARPFLFEKKSKLGITTFNNFFQNPESQFPFYFQWSTGEAYRFQSFNQIGNVSNEYLPTAEPLFLIRSDIKSHIFNASFVGNLNSLPAGTDFYTEQREIIQKELVRPKNKIITSPSLNYLALMGGDYGPWSFSFGTYYPTFLVRYYNEEQGLDEFREILSSKVSPIFRLMYTTKKLQLRGIYSKTNYDEGFQPNDKQLSIDRSISVIGLLKSFNFESHFLRLGSSYQLSRNIQVGIDQILLTAKYNENTTSGYLNHINFDHYITSLSVRHWFGEKVTLRLFVNYVNIIEDAKINSFPDNENLSDFSLGGAFEFVF